MRPLVAAVRRVPFDVHEREGLERIIASARVVVSVASLISTSFDPPAVPRFAVAVNALLLAYSVYSVAVLLLVRFRPATLLHRGVEVAAIDLSWAIAITTVTEGPSSHFSPPLFVFALLVATYRWGLLETAVVGAASIALLVSAELSTDRAFAWSVGDQDGAARVSDRALELISEGRTDYLFQTPAYADTWGAVHGTAGRELLAPRISGVDPDGRRVAADFALPDRVAGDRPWSSLTVTSTVVDDWRVRLILIDPVADATSDTELRFLQTISRQVGPALVNLYLVRRLRMKVQNVERARMARELHDGVIQALVGLDLEMEVARRQVGHATGDLAATLQRLQEMVREQVAEVDLPPCVCRELARIVGEALMNARKHSRATETKVSLAALDGGWQLLIDDNGRGFDFTGRLSHEEMAERRTGPAILTERVLEIGGRLWVQSMPGKGARLDIRVERRENL